MKYVTITVMKKVLENEIIKAINNNEIVIMPTDTVYGLMVKANAKNEKRLNKFKNRPESTKVSIIFPTIEDALQVIDNLSEDRIKMICDKLPGKYTFIVNLKESFYQKLGFTRQDYGIRVTNNTALQEVLKKTGPVLATSCNFSKEDICTNYEEIANIFDNYDIKVYYTVPGSNNASTIIDLTKEKISQLR